MNQVTLLFLLLGNQAWASKPMVKPMLKPSLIRAALELVKNDVLLEIEGNVYPKDQFPEACKELLKGVKCEVDPFGHAHIESKKEGDLVYSKSVFTGPDGPQVIEQSWEKNGHVQKAMVENHALQKLSELEVKGDKVFYKTTDLNDQSVKTSDDDYQENLVVPSTVMSYIRPFHVDLENGKEIEFRIAVLDRREAFTFRMKKVRDEKDASGDEVMVLEMAPSSLLVKALVAPMYFYVKVNSGEMFAFEGKSALRRKDGDKYKEMVVRTSYEYKINQFKLVTSLKKKVPESCGEAVLKSGEMKCTVPEIK